MAQQRVERLARLRARPKVRLRWAAGHQEALDLTAVHVERGRAERPQRVGRPAPPPRAEAAQVELDDGKVVREHGHREPDNTRGHASGRPRARCAGPREALHDGGVAKRAGHGKRRGPVASANRM